MDPDPDGAGEPEDRRRGVSGCPAPEAADPGSCNSAGAGAGAGAMRTDEEEEGLGVAGLRWKPMAALTQPATMAAGRLEADTVCGCRGIPNGRLGLCAARPAREVELRERDAVAWEREVVRGATRRSHKSWPHQILLERSQMIGKVYLI